MDRRNFFGSTLGFLIGSKVPFKIEEAKTIIMPAVVRLQKIAELFSCQDISKKFKIVIVTTDGIKFCAPEFKSIERDCENLKVIFMCEDVHVQQTITVKGVEFCTKDNIFLKSGNFSYDVPMVSGDTLKVSYTFDIPGLA